ncbi:MAG: hypothetical protein KA280_06845 [Thermomonas sp.]|nr:hypothetical protein [Thermomonas sp.]
MASDAGRSQRRRAGIRHYRGVHIVASIFWLSRVEEVQPDRWDIIGASICLFGAAMMLFAPRPAG